MARLIRIGLVLSVFGFTVVTIYFFYSTVESEIVVSDRMKDFIDRVDRHKVENENKLIVFDLDDTIFMSSQILGTPTWFYNMWSIFYSKAARQNMKRTRLSFAIQQDNTGTNFCCAGRTCDAEGNS